MSKEEKSLLFITKNYPPAIGGMENYCRDFVNFLKKSWNKVNLIANGKGKNYLLIFWIRALFQWLWYSFKSDAIRIGDGSISFFGWFFSIVTWKPWYVTIHALDITWNKSLYQKIIPWFVRRANGVVAVSTYTKEECIKRGVLEERITVIPNGIDSKRMPEIKTNKKTLLKKHWITEKMYGWKKVLFSIWRHIERKGIHWFLEEVVPNLWDEYIYCIAWSWPYTAMYKEIIASKWFKNVYLIGRISDEDKFSFYEHSDRFVMPNIKVEWDAEWFGIVCIEAGWYWCSVVASNLEWISDAIIDDRTWCLVKWNSSKKWINTIERISLKKWDILKKVQKDYSWEKLINMYLIILK